MSNKEIIEMLYELAKIFSGFDGVVRGLLKINDYITQVKGIEENENK